MCFSINCSIMDLIIPFYCNSEDPDRFFNLNIYKYMYICVHVYVCYTFFRNNDNDSNNSPYFLPCF